MVELNQYYTSEATSFLLASMLDVDNVETCLELSAGEGALIEPIKSISSNIRFTTVDLDEENTNKLKKKFPEDFHICKNALDSNLNIKPNSYDLAVCNPPFSYTRLGEDNRYIVDDFDSDLFKKSSKVRTEVLFIIRNIHYLKENATLAIIVPDFIFSSQTLARFRYVLFSQYTLSKVIECEHNSFKKTEAKTFILFIKKEKPKKNDSFISYLAISSKGIKENRIKLSSIFQKNKPEERQDINIFRGSRSSKDCRSIKQPFHHNYANLDDFSVVTYKPLSDKKLPNFKYADPGDILIHRVGRNIGKTVFLEKNSVIVSDCIIVVRFLDKKLRQKFIVQWHKCKNKWIEDNSKGTCARNISISNIREFINSLL